MTRNEASGLSMAVDLVFTMDNFIARIYDDFESELCKNCRFYSQDYCVNKKSISYGYQTYDEYGCNRFKRIQK